MNRKQTEQFIHENFGNIIQDWPWENYPSYSVFRHADNRKWFALFARVKYSTLKIDKAGEIDFVNLKCDPDLVEDLIKNSGVLSAYHMNKHYWITIPLDGSVKADLIKQLIELSYNLTAKRQKKTSL